MAQLEENVGYVMNGICLRNTTLKQLLVCPDGQESLPADELADQCQKLNIACPQVNTYPPFTAIPQAQTQGLMLIGQSMFMLPFLLPWVMSSTFQAEANFVGSKLCLAVACLQHLSICSGSLH